MTRERIGSLALLGVASRMAGAFAVGPAVSMVVAFLVARRGRYSFGNDDILEFALSPTGVATLIVAATLFLFAQTAEVASLLVLGRDAGGGAESPFSRSVVGTLRSAPRLLDLAAREAVGLTLLAAPFLSGVALTYWALWTGWDLNYLVQVRPPRFWIGATIAGMLGTAYGVLAFRRLVRWGLSVPIVLFEGHWGGAALKASRERVRGRWWRIAHLFAAWVASTVAAHLLVGLVVGGVARFVLNRVGDSVAVALPAAAGCLALDVLAIAAVGFAANAVGAFLLLQVYEGPEHSAPRFEAAPGSWTPGRTALFAASVGLAGIAMFLSVGLFASLHVDDDIAITAHRGDSREAPENTVPAFLRAIDAGADFGELDVQLSRDGYVVVAHDADLLRLAGLDRKIRDMTLDELRRVDLSGKFGARYGEVHVPTLEEVIDAVGDRLRLLIEIKVYPGDDVPALVEKTVDLIGRKRFGDRCVVISLDYGALQRVRRLDGGLRTGYLVSESVGDLTRLNVDALLMRAPLATQSLVDAARRRGKAVYAWTVDDPDLMVRLWDRGVANAITNTPRQMVAARAQVRSLTDSERMLLRVRYLLGG